MVMLHALAQQLCHHLQFLILSYLSLSLCLHCRASFESPRMPVCLMNDILFLISKRMAGRLLELVEVNLISPLVLASAAARHNAERGFPPPAMVWVASLSHQLSYPGAAVYGATKDGLVCR